mgnify:CR=1 FL=1
MASSIKITTNSEISFLNVNQTAYLGDPDSANKTCKAVNNWIVINTAARLSLLISAISWCVLPVISGLAFVASLVTLGLSYYMIQSTIEYLVDTDQKNSAQFISKPQYVLFGYHFWVPNPVDTARVTNEGEDPLNRTFGTERFGHLNLADHPSYKG